MQMTNDIENAVDEIQRIAYYSNEPPEWTIEQGQGETYASRNWTIYAQSVYPDDSVLAGMSSRVYVWEFDINTHGEEGSQTAAIAACK